MIKSHDRSYYIGASDTSFVVGNWDTKTFEKWYGTKLGIYTMDYVSQAMQTGTAYEHRILDALNIPGLEKDKQIIKGRLRVNLDGNVSNKIYEVKTTLSMPKSIPKDYREQVVVEMYAFEIYEADIVFYELTQAEYNNFYLDIDPSRIHFFPVGYDADFIEKLYLPCLEYLSECLDKGVFPKWNLPVKLKASLTTL